VSISAFFRRLGVNFVNYHIAPLAFSPFGIVKGIMLDHIDKTLGIDRTQFLEWAKE